MMNGKALRGSGPARTRGVNEIGPEMESPKAPGNPSKREPEIQMLLAEQRRLIDELHKVAEEIGETFSPVLNGGYPDDPKPEMPAGGTPIGAQLAEHNNRLSQGISSLRYIQERAEV